ncbi:metallophosphoesterase [Peterkaempfera griseoplana]|uniref:metallophosphoesterase n=1 Tax=Peterkaempfera griseoplana TaxID=66896 RepID=UPI000A9246C1|nr:metallophosphoesterase [Peterkaempfera griseoplana]
MTPEDRFPGPELPESGPRARMAVDPRSYGHEGGLHGGPQQSWPAPGLPSGGPEPQAVRGWFEEAAVQAAHSVHTAPQDPPTLDLGGPVGTPSPVEHAGALGTSPEADPDQAVGPLYVVGDVHGYLGELHDALREQGLVDADGHWSAGRSRIWFLGDFTDRGPDGIGVIDLVMQLAAEAAAAGGYCRALMGNHELLLLGAHRWGDEPVQSTAGTASFLAAWRLNGGQQQDMDRLEPHHISWLARLPAMAVEDGHLLLHSDTTAYLEYGGSIDEVNDTVHQVLASDDADEWWDCFRRFTKRFAFRGDTGPASAGELLDTYGGHRVVHGHSPIPYLTGDAHSEDGHASRTVTGPHVYADELAVAMDGGVTMEGRLLVARLPLA